MFDVGYSEPVRLLKEDRLKQISRSIRSFVPADSPEDSDLDQRIKEFKTLLDKVFITSSAPNLTVIHRVAAWNTLCSLINQSLESTVTEVREIVWTDGVWDRAFQLYLQHAQNARPKSSRQLLATLTSALRKTDSRDLSNVKRRAAGRLVSALLDYQDPASAKVSAQLLAQLLSKGIVGLDDVSRSFRHCTADPDENEQILAALFKWLGNGDFGSTIAHLVSVLLDKMSILDGSTRIQPVWIGPLQNVFTQSAVNADDLRAHVLPTLFQRNFDDFVTFLRIQGLDIWEQPSKTATPSFANEELLYTALQTGKELGLLDETDENHISRGEASLRIPVWYVGSLISRNSRLARITGLHLLITSLSATTPFSRKSLSLLRQALDVAFADVDADFRGDVFGAFQKLVDRFRSITATLSRRFNKANEYLGADGGTVKAEEQLSSHRAFLIWLVKFFSWQLRPTASYQRHISALKCLVVLAKSGIDDSIPSECYSKSAVGGTKWPFQIDIMSRDMKRLLLDLVFDPFDDVMSTASLLLALIRPGLDGDVQNDSDTVLERAEIVMLSTGRADHADGVAHLHALQNRQTPGSTGKPSHKATPEQLLDKLEQMMAIAQRSLAEAVAKYPIHGLLTSLRYVMTQGQDKDVSLQQRLLKDLNIIWEIVKPVLCNDAPEGYSPDVADEGLDSTKETLSYCWRALKEASLLMSSLVASHQIEKTDLQTLSDLCFAQLAELRHRGAFSTVAQTWMTCCMQCKDLKTLMGVSMLVTWYMKVLDMLRKNVTINTRRSAGIPSLLCGILIADKSTKLLTNAMADLEMISRQLVDATSAEEGILPQVHAMNCLKDILKNARLGEQSERYVPVALQLAADALRSDVWAIRNCGLMLFRAVIDRLLGTDQSHFDDDFASQRHISAHQHPRLIDVILDLLPDTDEARTGLSTGYEGVFPALQLLQHTQVPAYRFAEVKAAVQRLTGSASWHIRDKAARSLAALMASMMPVEALESAQALMMVNSANPNALHGAMLTALYYISRLKRGIEQSDGLSSQLTHTQLRAFSATFVDQLWSFSREPSCFVTRAAALDVMRAFQGLLSEFNLPAMEMNLSELDQILSPQDLDCPEMATLRQATARLMAQRLSAKGPSSDEDASCCEEWALHLARNDENACEHFLRSCNPLGSASISKVGVSIYLICAEILNSDLSIHLKCEAQRLLLALPVAQWPEHTALIQEAMDPGAYLAEAGCNQRYADQWLQIRAPRLEISAVNFHESGNDIFEETSSWIGDCVAAVDGEGLHSREAATLAIDRLSHLWSLMTSDPQYHYQLLRLCIAVYDLLNDDDEDTRLRAADITQRILASGSEGMVQDMEPITASRKLLAFCITRWPSSQILAETAFKRAFDISQQLPTPVADQLEMLSHGDTALFVEEKQNLYIDLASEVRVWSRVAQRLSTVDIPQRLVRNLSVWVSEGLKALADQADKYPDGALGWSSKADTFKLVLQVVYGAEVLLTLVRRGVKLPVRPSELRKQLFACSLAFEKADVSPLLRWETDRILSEAVVQKVALVGERILAVKRGL